MKLNHYNSDQLKNISVAPEQGLRVAMNIMSENALRLIPVVEPETMRLVGVLADGDIRRFLLTGSLDALVKEAANTTPIVATTEITLRNARSEMSTRGVDYLPVVKDGIVTDLFVLWAVYDSPSITAVIMAGGLGSRLSPITDNCPKPLVELGDKPILGHIIEHLRDQGVDRFVLCLNYLGDMIVDRFGHGSELGVQIEYVTEKMRLGTGGALSLVNEEWLTDSFLCMNGDILTDLDVSALTDEHNRSGSVATMVTRDFHYTVPYGVIQRDDHGRFLGSSEKPTVSFPINAGIYMLQKPVLSEIPKDEFFDLPTLFQKLLSKGQAVGTHAHEGRWIDIGTIDELERARKILQGTT